MCLCRCSLEEQYCICLTQADPQLSFRYTFFFFFKDIFVRDEGPLSCLNTDEDIGIAFKHI